MFVDEKQIWRCIPCDEQICPPIVIGVDRDNAKRPSNQFVETGMGTDVGKSPVMIIVKQRERHSLIGRLCAVTAHAIHCTSYRLIKRKLYVVRDYQIQETIAVVIKPRRAGRPAVFVTNSRFNCDLRESSVSIIVE